MPITSIGYRHWEGKRTGPLRRAIAIARSEIQIAYQGSKLLRRFLVFAWMPILYFCPFFLAMGYALDPNNDLEEGLMLTEIATEFFSREAIEVMRQNPSLFLPAIWSIAFYFFFAYTQSLFSMVVVAIVGPPLISRDLKSKAFLVYFSKPIRAWQYLLGKLLTIVFFVFSMTLFPGLFLYVVGIALSPDASTAVATLPVVLSIPVSAVVIAIPVGLVVLVLSSITRDRRIATFAWVALWIFGEVAFRILSIPSNFSQTYETPPWASFLSLRETTMQATSGLFDVRGNLEAIFTGLGESGERLHRIVLGMASDMGEAQFMDGPRSEMNVLDLGGGGLPPWVSMLFLAGLSLLCALFVMRRATKPVRI